MVELQRGIHDHADGYICGYRLGMVELQRPHFLFDKYIKMVTAWAWLSCNKHSLSSVGRGGSRYRLGMVELQLIENDTAHDFKVVLPLGHG